MRIMLCIFHRLCRAFLCRCTKAEFFDNHIGITATKYMKGQNETAETEIKMKNTKLGEVIAFVLRSMNEETRQTDEEAEEQMKRLIRKLVLEGYVNEQK